MGVYTVSNKCEVADLPRKGKRDKRRVFWGLGGLQNTEGKFEKKTLKIWVFNDLVHLVLV